MNNIYVIYGTDYDLIKRKIDGLKENIIDVVKYNLLETNIKELLDDASCISLFGDKKVIIGENATFLTSEAKDINHDINYLEKYINYPVHDNILILYVISEKLDERKKIVKLLKEKCNIVNVLPVDDKNINNFVLNEFKIRGYKISSNDLKYFISYVGKDVGRLLNEIEKLTLYKDEDKVIVKQDIDEISSKVMNDNIFDFCDAIMKKDFKRIFELYNDLVYLKTDSIKIISVIANQFILVYQAKLLSKSGLSEKSIALKLNVHPYRIKLALETDYMIYELKDMIEKLHNLDVDIKSGKISDKIGLEKFLIAI